MSEEERAYDIRYCAFLDILGFTDLIGQIGKGNIEYGTVRELLRNIHQPSKWGPAGTADFRATTVSDAIVLSSSFSANGLAIIVDVICALTLGALETGYFMRGGLCRGKLYHDNEMVFGEAFNNAYRIESSVARFPRVMVTKQVYDEAVDSNLSRYFREMLIQADDGPYFVNVLQSIRNEFVVIASGQAPAGIPEKRQQDFLKMRDLIEQRVAEAADNPNHFEKSSWFARYWNNTLTSGRSNLRVNGPGLDIVQWRNSQ